MGKCKSMVEKKICLKILKTIERKTKGENISSETEDCVV